VELRERLNKVEVDHEKKDFVEVLLGNAE